MCNGSSLFGAVATIGAENINDHKLRRQTTRSKSAAIQVASGLRAPDGVRRRRVRACACARACARVCLPQTRSQCSQTQRRSNGDRIPVTAVDTLPSHAKAARALLMVSRRPSARRFTSSHIWMAATKRRQRIWCLVARRIQWRVGSKTNSTPSTISRPQSLTACHAYTVALTPRVA